MVQSGEERLESGEMRVRVWQFAIVICRGPWREETQRLQSGEDEWMITRLAGLGLQISHWVCLQVLATSPTNWSNSIDFRKKLIFFSGFQVPVWLKIPTRTRTDNPKKLSVQIPESKN